PPSHNASSAAGRSTPHPMHSCPGGKRRSPHENAAPAPAPAPARLPSRPPDPRHLESPALALHHPASVSRPIQPAAVSNCPRTSDSKACRGCLQASPRIPQTPHHHNRAIRPWIEPAYSSPRPIVSGSRMAWPCSLNPPASRLSHRPRPDDVAPSLHSHYSRFITTTDHSVPAPRIGTICLVFLAT